MCNVTVFLLQGSIIQVRWKRTPFVERGQVTRQIGGLGPLSIHVIAKCSRHAAQDYSWAQVSLGDGLSEQDAFPNGVFSVTSVLALVSVSSAT
jgi:hypothetical protein